MNWIRFLGYIALFNCLVANAQVSKYSNEFLQLGVGARAQGMAGATIASVNDVYAGYWNPAALLEVKDNLQLAFMHNEQFAGIVKHDFGAIAFKLSNGNAIGFSMIRLGVDDIANTLNLMQTGQIDYTRVTSFSAVDYAFITSYAQKLPIEGLDIGANVKIIRRVVGDFANAWGFGFDVAARYKKDALTMAAVMRDATSTFNVWQTTFTDDEKQVLLATGNLLPSNNLEITVPKLMVGGSYLFKFWDEKISVLPEVNIDFSFDGKRNTLIQSNFASIDQKIGVETGYKNMFFLRGGVNQLQRVRDIDGSQGWSVMPTLGVGLQLKKISVDYAMADVGGASGVLPYSNIVSVRLNINRRVE